MRSRLGMKSLPVAICVAGTLIAGTATVAHGQSGGVNGGDGGAHNTQGGAEAIANYTNAGNPGPSGTGTGGGTKQYDCYWQTIGQDDLGGDGDGDKLTETQLQEIFDADGLQDGETMSVRLRCDDPDTGEAVFDGEVEWPGATIEDLVDPEALAQDARDAIVLPAPHVETSPPIDSGTYAQLDTYLGISNWEQSLTAEAVAGPVEVVVTAEPVEQYWTFHDRFRGGTDTVTCGGPGSADAESGDCIYTFAHSSDGQPNGNDWQAEGTGEPCFYSTVTVQWEFSWTLNGAAQGSLEDGYVSGSTCLVVAEVQAVVDDG